METTEMILILVRQIVQMFLYALIGFLLFRGKLITKDGSKAIGNILIYLALPAVIINGFLVERTPERIGGVLWSGVMGAALLLLSILVSRLFFRKDPVAAFAGAFSNPGFFGIPLIIASLGQGSVFYAACFIAFLNIGQWTYGVSVLIGQPLLQGFHPKKLIKAPFFIATLIGLLCFFAQIKLPSIATGTVSALAALNTPLAMFTVGIYLAQTDILKMFTRAKLYALAGVRLLLIPALGALLLLLLPQEWREMKLALLLVSACPVGSNVAVYAQLHGADYPYAVQTVVVSTLLSILTIPAAVWFSSLIW